MIRVNCWWAGPVIPWLSVKLDFPAVDAVPFVVAERGDGVRGPRLVESVEGAAGNLKSRGGGCGRRAGSRNDSGAPSGLVAKDPGRLGRPTWEVSTLRLLLGCSFGASANGNGKACVGVRAGKRSNQPEGLRYFLVLLGLYLSCKCPRSYCSSLAGPEGWQSVHGLWLAWVDWNGAEVAKATGRLDSHYQLIG